MNEKSLKKYWEHIYQNKKIEDFSWYQAKPTSSLNLIDDLHLPKNVKIIDVGGGDSFLVDYLLDEGYQNITVLDISKKAIDRAKNRLGKKANNIHWIVSDITNSSLPEAYDLWHDRATFHFLTDQKKIKKYIKKAQQHIAPNGTLILGTFSKNGPNTCSGLMIQKYSEKSLNKQFSGSFDKVKCKNINHKTPSDTVQKFLFCTFTPKNIKP